MRDRIVHASFADALRPFQRRLRFLIIVESLPLACAIAVPLAAAIVLSVRPNALLALTIVAASPLIGALVVATRVFLWPPSPGETAALVDRRYGLEERATTALEFADQTDPVSQRIVADARARLTGVDPRELTASLPRHTWWLASAAVVSLAAMFVFLHPAGPAADDLHDLGGAIRGSANSGARRPAVVGAPGQRSSTAAAAPVETMSASAAQTRLARESENTSRTAGQPQPSTNGEEHARGSSTANEASAPRPGSAPSGEGEPAAAGNQAHASLSSSSLRKGGPADPLSSEGRAGVPARDGGSAGRMGRAGGIAGGAVLSGAPATRRTPAADSITEAQYQRAAAHAETAIAQQRVPREFREYVRDYFLSLRQGGRQ